ncbi:hypothetical protein GCM10023156_35370 [Novipirellula rosea]|uniref:Uncharacterized protein n=1 Tax=Novipirellula rosea TaxID=1031540 RepID=A0ABP8N068_9BACT
MAKISVGNRLVRTPSVGGTVQRLREGGVKETGEVSKDGSKEGALRKAWARGSSVKKGALLPHREQWHVSQKTRKSQSITGTTGQAHPQQECRGGCPMRLSKFVVRREPDAIELNFAIDAANPLG